ncbi:portal protein [Methylobacter sp. Wu1]|uniref:portal protein n=1 Tax=Methylobacter sp. Wu1 TaxID=3119359 RepID=UPI002F94034D
MADSDILKDALEAFKLAAEAEKENRDAALSDLKFARLAEQWPENVRQQREQEGRPCLTINRLPAFIRQVVNDSRQNKPSIKIHPADSEADPETAEIINGLIRNIEYTSNADVAYDTALESAVTMGFGYWRVNVDYAHDDSFDKDIVIETIANPFSVYGDPESTKADSSDWMRAFVVNTMPKHQFKAKYKGANDRKGWDEAYQDLPAPWMENEFVQVAEYWTRDEVPKVIVQLSNGMILDAEKYKANQDTFDTLGLVVTGDRQARSYKVMQRIMSGAEILENNDWAGRYIPIIPVYGEEINVEGKRVLRSLVRDAKDPQRMFNYWRTTSTELVALAPKAPYIGPKGSFNTDAAKWQTANTKSWPYIEFDGGIPPQRQPFDGVPAGALQEALNASDDMKAIIGIYDAGMGARSNETSGKAIMARQRESDTSTFHFIDNLNRSIRHTGRILIDLIPHVYNGDRIIRVLGGDDGKQPQNVRIGQQSQLEEGAERIYDLSAGKYDLTVSTGPSFTTRREEAANQMIELLRAFPQAAPFIGDMLAKNLDWPGADEISKRLKIMLPPQLQNEDGPTPQEMQMQHTIEQGKQMLQQMQARIAELEQDKSLEVRKLDIDAYKAESDRVKAVSAGMTPETIQTLVVQTIMQVLQSPDILPNQQPAASQGPANLNQ